MGMLEGNNTLSIGERLISAYYELAGLEKPALVKIIQRKEEERGFKATVFTEHAIISRTLSFIIPVRENIYKVRKDMCK